MFVMLRGTAAVSVARNGTGIRVGLMRPGDCFAEIALLTGEPRCHSSRRGRLRSVGNQQACDGRGAARFAAMPDRAQRTLAKRKLEGDNIVKDAPLPDDQGKKEREYRASFLHRLRTVFDL
jgi:hypothetical protein